ncbi:MAG: 23S ribosomal RNA methyltransferase Erm [Chloroflexota bacterium]
MAKKPHNRIPLAQNFLRSSKLVRELLDASSIGPSDTVYEIGPGCGIITAELARAARQVIAIEKDPRLVQGLRQRFRKVENVQIVQGDFLYYRITDREYKIFANIPYNITADIVRKILYLPPNPCEAYLIMQREAAGKFSGVPNETLFSVLTKPWFDFRIVRHLRRTDFDPMPSVDSALLQIQKRSPPLVSEENAVIYRRFVRFGFGRWKKSLKLAFKPIFTYEQWKRLSHHFGFPLNAAPTQLTFDQWLGLFDCFKHRVPAEKQVYLEGGRV